MDAVIHTIFVGCNVGFDADVVGYNVSVSAVFLDGVVGLLDADNIGYLFGDNVGHWLNLM